MISHLATGFHPALIRGSQAHTEDKSPERPDLEEEEDSGGPEPHTGNLTVRALIRETDASLLRRVSRIATQAKTLAVRLKPSAFLQQSFRNSGRERRSITRRFQFPLSTPFELGGISQGKCSKEGYSHQNQCDI
jgi:hypothetical protein